jgi:hypothetical protein
VGLVNWHTNRVDVPLTRVRYLVLLDLQFDLVSIFTVTLVKGVLEWPKFEYKPVQKLSVLAVSWLPLRS